MPQITIDCCVTVNVQWNYRRIVLFNWIGSLAVKTRSHVSLKPTSKALSHQIESLVRKKTDKGKEVEKFAQPRHFESISLDCNWANTRKQDSIVSCRDWRCLAGVSLCVPLNMCVLLFDEVSPLTTYLDSSHICVCSDAPNKHLYPCAEAYGGFSGMRHNNRTFAVFKKTHLHGVFSHLHSWDHRRKQHCFCEAYGGDYLLLKCHTNILCVKRLDSPVSLGATGDWCIIC